MTPLVSKKVPTDWTGVEVVPGQLGLINHGYAILILSYNQNRLRLISFIVALPKSSQNRVVILASLFATGGRAPGAEPKDVGTTLLNFL